MAQDGSLERAVG